MLASCDGLASRYDGRCVVSDGFVRRLAPVFVCAVVAAVLLNVRANNSAERELVAGQAAEHREDLERAVIYYRRAAGWLLPAGDADEKAMAALKRLQAQAREDSDAALELSAARARLAAAHTRRWATTSQNLGPVAARIAELSITAASSTQGDGRPLAERRASLQAQLLDPSQPRAYALLLAVLGFVCWTGAAFLLSTRGFDADTRLTAHARILGTWIVVGFGLFALGLALA